MIWNCIIFDWQIIRKYPKRSLDEFIGDQNFAAHELRMMNKTSVAHYGDIKNTLRLMVFGMGPLELPKVKSLCIAGPPKCGKKLLVEALCTEMEAVMFDLSAPKVKPIADMDEFLSFVMQMAKKLQPSVIFIEGAHKPFIRVVTNAEFSENPRKLGQFLMKKIVKKLKNEDAIMLMGTTNQPWNCNFMQLRQCYEKIVAFPPTLDYGTALMTWNKGLRLKKIYNFDASSLARVTRNYTIGDILDLIDRHVDLRRKMK
jgi:IQ and AAA domain-containing protein